MRDSSPEWQTQLTQDKTEMLTSRKAALMNVMALHDHSLVEWCHSSFVPDVGPIIESYSDVGHTENVLRNPSVNFEYEQT